MKGAMMRQVLSILFAGITAWCVGAPAQAELFKAPLGRDYKTLHLSFFSFRSQIHIAYATRIVNGREALCGAYRITGNSGTVAVFARNAMDRLGFLDATSGAAAMAYNFTKVEAPETVATAQVTCRSVTMRNPNAVSGFVFAGPYRYRLIISTDSDGPEFYDIEVREGGAF
jgi:hypothetical protein